MRDLNAASDDDFAVRHRLLIDGEASTRVPPQIGEPLRPGSGGDVDAPVPAEEPRRHDERMAPGIDSGDADVMPWFGQKVIDLGSGHPGHGGILPPPLLDAVTAVTGAILPPPGVPGPFALSDGDHLRRLFAGAGFDDIALEPVATSRRPTSFDAWWARALEVAAPAVGILNRLDDATRTRVRDTLCAAVSPYETNGGLELPGLVLVLTVRRP